MIVVVGSLNVDYVVRVPRHPSPGETLLGSDYARSFGGKGANQAVAAARLGAVVRMVGCLGEDTDGEALRRALGDEGIDTSGVTSVSGGSGAAFITVDPSGQNAIVVAPGANARLVPEHLTPALFEGARAVVLQLEIPAPAVRVAARLGRAAGALVILNAAPMRALASADLEDVAVLVVNEHEAGLLAEREAPGSPTEALAVASSLRPRVPAIVITLGACGAVWAGKEGSFHEPAFPVVPMDTTGAGDAFVGALAVELAARAAAREAVRFANAAGALATTRHGAQKAMPRRDEVLRFVTVSAAP